MATQHADLTPDSWRRYSREQQLLSLGAEMNRARKRVRTGDRDGARLGYERILNLVDLTIVVRDERPLRRELLLWRDLIAWLYIQPEPLPDEHDQAFRALLSLSPSGHAQIDALAPRRAGEVPAVFGA